MHNECQLCASLALICVPSTVAVPVLDRKGGEEGGPHWLMLSRGAASWVARLSITKSLAQWVGRAAAVSPLSGSCSCPAAKHWSTSLCRCLHPALGRELQALWALTPPALGHACGLYNTEYAINTPVCGSGLCITSQQ